MSLLTADLELARDSYYAATAPRGVRFPALHGDTQADVAIVGGGLAGLSAAIELADRGFDVALLEAKEIGGGASGRNGGQVIHGLACDPSVIEAQLGLAEARRVWDMTIEAMALIKSRIARFGIACDWQDGYIELAVGERKGHELQAWADRIEAVYGYSLTRIAPNEMPHWIASPRYHSGIHDARSGHLHPLKYSLGLARAAHSLGVRLYEGSAVVAMDPGVKPRLRCMAGSVSARHVLLAGNVYLQRVAQRLEARIMPVGTYIVCTERLPHALATSLIPSRSAVSDSNFALDYFRVTADDRLLFGGQVSYSTRTPRHLVQRMHGRIVRAFPQLRDTHIDYAWGGFIDITMNRAPDFGRLDGNVYYLQGFSGHGLALTGLAGKLVAEAIGGDASRFDTFARLKHRRFPGGRLLRMPALVLGMAYYRLKDLL
ncbi:MAG TPA: FAD-binding oxidoreductase [Burkholderiaceae bacterium]|jgi:gamma-glutamylputrescine oxidase|nr:FAD-binding oxidoreductase [Burkholderiaceae bacterium]